MKIKHFILGVVLLAGLVSSLRLKAEGTAPTCPGSGQECATGPDGTIYQKGLDQ
jgi:hypothetical protein